MRISFFFNCRRIQLCAEFDSYLWQMRWFGAGESVGHWALAFGLFGFGFRYQWRRIPVEALAQ